MPKEDIERLIAAAVTNKEVERRLLLGDVVLAAEKAKKNNQKSSIDLDEYDIDLLRSIAADTLAEYTKKLSRFI
jgi:hypothetical protein